MNGPQGKLFVDDGGRGGVPVVFLHSAAGSTKHWTAQLGHLRQTRRAVAIDLRGHGQSDQPRDGHFEIAQLASDVAAVVDALDLPPFVLVGHSMGGAVAVSYAGQHPGRLAGLFLLDPAADLRKMPPDQAKAMMAGLRSDAWIDAVWAFWEPTLERSSPAVRERLRADLRAANQAAIAGPLEDQLHFDPAAAMSRYDGPRLSIITAANETPAAYHRVIPRLPFQKVEGTGHWVQLDKPQLVNGLLDEFLSSLEET